MNLSLTSDWVSDWGCPEESLRAIASAGFSHVHWCHHWNTDFLYSASEIAQIRRWFSELGLKLLDLHGTAGKEKRWWSEREYERQAGVELVCNRIHMAAELGAATVVTHIPMLPDGATNSPECDRVRLSLDELAPTLRKTGIRLSFENMPDDNFEFIRQLLAEYPEDIAGICYDCGHGNMGKGLGLHYMESLKHRLIAVHLHDNDGVQDLHQNPFTGTVKWGELARMIKTSGYKRCVNLESGVWPEATEEMKSQFLVNARAAGIRLTEMIASAL